MFTIGTDRVGIVGATVSTTKTDLFEAEQTGETIAWVDGCLFEIQTGYMRHIAVEHQDVETTTTSEVAHCFMPSVDGQVETSLGPIAFTDITSTKHLREFATGRDYLMRGDAVFEVGKCPHVFAQCERQK